MIEVAGYRVLREIASGSSGTVYLAVQENLGREVALKVLAAGLFEEGETRARFLREAKVQARLSHPNLLALFDAGFAAGRPWLAAEIVEGGSLRDRLARAPTPGVAEAVRLAGEIALGLAYAHRTQIVHRDLKPENVLLTLDGQVKIADFGLAKVMSATETIQTATGVVLGTPGYLAPEAIRGEAAGPPADVYALGVILFETLAGRRPFEADDAVGILRAQLTGVAPSLGELSPEATPGLVELVSLCLERAPERRPSAGTVARRLGLVGASESDDRPASGRRSAAKASVTRRVHPSASAAAARTVAGGGVQPDRPALKPGRLLFGAAAGLLLVGLALRGPRPSEPVPDAAAAAGVPARPGAASAEPLPDIVRISVGLDRAHVDLSGPAPSGLAVTRWIEGESARTPVPLAAGRPDCTVERLAPGKPYVVEVALGNRTARRSFRTLAMGPAGGSVLHERGFETRGLELRARGEEVIAAWADQLANGDQIVRCRRSADAGTTWNPVEDLSERQVHVTWPAVLWDEQGLSVAWTSGSRTHSTHFNVRSLQPGGGPTLEYPSGSHESGLLRAPGGYESVVWVDVSDAERDNINLATLADSRPPRDLPWGAAIRWVSLGPGKKFVESSGQPPTVPHVHKDRRCSVLVRVGGRLLFFFLRRNDATQHDGVYVTSSVRPERGEWSAPRRVTNDEEDVEDSPDVAAIGDRIAVGYRSTLAERVRISTDGGARFSDAVQPSGSDVASLRSTLTVSEGAFYAAELEVDALEGRIQLQVQRSLDGCKWDPIASRSLLPRQPLMLRLALPAGRPLAAFLLEDGAIVTYRQ
ncbi:MAG: serine/threonine protein kinase [Candidatus Wallbacteria bacterium]|nr:serine/threonine protein kinase [Candidatus Wallbacteria bacterium]